MRELSIRPSTVSSMMLCPARQTLKDEGDAYQPSEPLVFGSLVHWRIEQHMLNKSVDGFDDMARALQNIYRKDTGPSGDVHNVASKRTIREMINEVMVAFEEWVNVVLPQLPAETPIVEQTLTCTIWEDNDHSVVLTGTPDVIYPMSGVIVDWKTAGKNWNKDKVESQVQPWAYSYMAHAEHDIAFDVFDFWVYDRSTESWWRHRHDLSNIGDAHTAFVEQAAAFAKLVDSGLSVFTPAGSGWKPRGWHCSPKYCDQWEWCSGKFLVADGQATLPALTTKEKGWG